jgi:hypothetical protein
LWEIWAARRKAIHEGEFQSPMSRHCFVRGFLNDLASIPKTVIHVRPPAQTIAPKWIPPLDGHAKANLDGAVSRSELKGSLAVHIQK